MFIENTKLGKLYKILKMQQNEVKRYAKKELKKAGYKPILADGFIYAEGDLPILMLAHMDTVYDAPKYVKNHDGVLTGSKGLGADDRAGVYSILHLVEKGYRPHVLFLEDEEIGCVGAKKFVATGIKPEVNFAIELDRRGLKDSVYYECDNEDFTNFINSFGFATAFGSCSDISRVCPAIGVAGVNLSIGYFSEHTEHEILLLSAMEDTIKKVENIFKTKLKEKYDYIEAQPIYSTYSGYYDWFTESYGKQKKNKKKKKIKSTPKYFPSEGEMDYLPCEFGYLIFPEGNVIDIKYNSAYLIGSDDCIYTYAGQQLQGVEWVDDDWSPIYYERLVF